MKSIYKTSFGSSLATLVYIGLVATLMQNGEKLFGKTDNFLTPIAILLLFTLSALIVGFLLLGRPILLYLDNKKEESISFLVANIAWMAAFTIIALLIQIITK